MMVFCILVTLGSIRHGYIEGDQMKIFNANGNKDDIMPWFRRLDHASVTTINDMLIYVFYDNKSSLNNCEICPLSRHTMIPFPSTHNISNSLFDLLHLDIYGSYNTQIFDLNRFFHTMVIWISLLKFKRDVL